MDQQLLPGIPDAVTLNEIVPKLSATAFHISAISRAWLHAARSYEVYNSRVQSHSTETHVIVTYDRPGRIGPVIALYCTRDNSCAELPSIPNSGGRIFEGYNFVYLDGKVYVLGGIGGGLLNWVDQLGSDEVYALDLRACQRQWKQCASMTKPRKKFTYGIREGCEKIYVFEGLDGKEKVLLKRERIFDHTVCEANLEVEDMWHVLFGGGPSGKHFVASGKYHYMTLDGIFTIDAKGDPMTQLHSFSLPVILPDARSSVLSAQRVKALQLVDNKVILPDTGPSVLSARRVEALQLVDNELLAMVSYRGEFDDESDGQFHLLRTAGFGGKNEEFVWQRVQVPLSSGILFHGHNTLEYTVRL